MTIIQYTPFEVLSVNGHSRIAGMVIWNGLDECHVIKVPWDALDQQKRRVKRRNELCKYNAE